MRRIFLLCFAWVFGGAVSVWGASPWGVLATVVDEPQAHTRAVDNLLDKRPIRYAAAEGITPQESAIFAKNIARWPQETLRFIKKRHRTQEFQDILPLLQDLPDIIQVSPDEAPDVVVSLTTELKDGVCGDFKPKDDTYAFHRVRVNLNERATFRVLTLHELGHYFGLADQYAGGRFNSHEEYSSDINRQEKSIMDAADSDADGLSCDDADGFINLIDLRLSQRNGGQFSARAQKGWKSLCPSSKNIYQQARTITRKPIDPYALDMDSSTSLTSREYSRGRLTRRVSGYIDDPLQLFAITPKDTAVRDPKTGRVTRIESVLDGVVSRPGQEEETEESSPLTWVREFTYKRAFEQDGQTFIPVHITERLNGEFLRERQILIGADGSVDNLPLWLGSDGLFIKAVTYKIGFALQNRHITKFVIEDPETALAVVGYPDDEVIYLSEDGGTHFDAYRFPLDYKAPGQLRYYVEDIYKPHRQHLMSFYQNFYEPLFVAPEEHILKQIKQSVRLPR